MHWATNVRMGSGRWRAMWRRASWDCSCLFWSWMVKGIMMRSFSSRSHFARACSMAKNAMGRRRSQLQERWVQLLLATTTPPQDGTPRPAISRASMPPRDTPAASQGPVRRSASLAAWKRCSRSSTVSGRLQGACLVLSVPTPGLSRAYTFDEGPSWVSSSCGGVVRIGSRSAGDQSGRGTLYAAAPAGSRASGQTHGPGRAGAGRPWARPAALLLKWARRTPPAFTSVNDVCTRAQATRDRQLDGSSTAHVCDGSACAPGAQIRSGRGRYTLPGHQCPK